jgi:protoporphyrinogen/coproporphyrinogen III oxidase
MREVLAVSEQRIVVVGAGLAGLSVAARLVSAGKRALVLEAGTRAGGQIQTLRQGPLLVELGAEGFIARSRSVPALCQLLGIEHALIDQLTTDTYAVDDGRLALLPAGEAARRLGFQVPPEELGRGIRSLALGMGQLIDALVERIGSANVRLCCEVRALRSEPPRLTLELQDGSSLDASTVVLAAPARVSAALVASLGLGESRPLERAPLMSNVSVGLLYESKQFARYPAGSGLIFPEATVAVGLRALSLVDHKFAGRVPPGQALLRVFFRPVADALETWSDERFASEAVSAIGSVLEVTGSPREAWVSRWPDALPVFSAEHRAAAAALDGALQRLGVHVTGSAFHGAGIDAAVTSAENVAARLASATE